ncbi:hypothetical protein PR048_018285 [Dryococelus australis]|uniref:Uncharacterized protein n=1 Tax=Dryococelus australis TaxID=614101 RepID=A0ABQ9HC24_9NEOP|nr:hypothetical protein PR048_018285 [Dryococelus australis]
MPALACAAATRNALWRSDTKPPDFARARPSHRATWRPSTSCAQSIHSKDVVELRGLPRIMPDDAASCRVFLGISHFFHPFISAMLHTHLASPSLALKTSLLRAAQILFTHSLKYMAIFSSRILHITAQNTCPHIDIKSVLESLDMHGIMVFVCSDMAVSRLENTVPSEFTFICEQNAMWEQACQCSGVGTTCRS